MEALLAARDALREIVQNDTLFTTAIKKTFSTHPLSAEDESFARTALSSTLHHFLLLNRLVDDAELSLSIDQRCLLLVVLGNEIFLKRRLDDIALKAAKKELILADNNLTEERLEVFLSSAIKDGKIIPSEIDENSVEYLSFKYNTPQWLIHMWQKHFGRPVTTKILAANARPLIQACRVNTLLTTREKVLEDPDFIEGPIENTIIYRGRTPLKKKQQYLDCSLFQQRLGVKKVIDSLPMPPNGSCLIYEERPNAFYIEMAVHTNNEIFLSVAANSMERRLDIRKAARDYHIAHIEVFESTPELLITHVSAPVDCVICLPECSKFDLIRSLPDFFIHFHQASLDTLITKQKLAIQECSRFVMDGGALLYSVNTINNKEGHFVVIDFLSHHPEFVLDNERQFLPFEEYNVSSYAALLRKSTVKK